MNQDELNDVFKALASEPRRRILHILSVSTPMPGKTCCGADEMCACRLVDLLGLAPSTISHHMSILRKACLVDARKDGLWTYYTLRRDVLETVIAEFRDLWSQELGDYHVAELVASSPRTISTADDQTSGR
jgi:ArsR family transcriptional regulator